jgi:hypothetical protein
LVYSNSMERIRPDYVIDMRQETINTQTAHCAKQRSNR